MLPFVHDFTPNKLLVYFYPPSFYVSVTPTSQVSRTSTTEQIELVWKFMWKLWKLLSKACSRKPMTLVQNVELCVQPLVSVSVWVSFCVSYLCIGLCFIIIDKKINLFHAKLIDDCIFCSHQHPNTPFSIKKGVRQTGNKNFEIAEVMARKGTVPQWEKRTTESVVLATFLKRQKTRECTGV